MPNLTSLLMHFYPRPPRGGRQLRARWIAGTIIFLSTPSARRATNFVFGVECVMIISIHALREEGDSEDSGPLHQPDIISIHALREEGDVTECVRVPVLPNFYPRPPRGGRRWGRLKTSSDFIFLSTPSARRATNSIFHVILSFLISIHALREEGDSKNGEKHLRFCFIIKRSAQIWKSFSKNIRKNSCDLHRTA